MPAIIKNNINTFSANQFLNMFNTNNDVNWITGTLYNIGDIVTNANRRYIASTTGTSGVNNPTHINGIVSDGSVDWLFIENDIDNDYYHNNLYMVLGKSTQWDDDNIPPTPLNSDNNDIQDLQDAIMFKRVYETNVKLALKRYDWISGTLYDSYDKNVEDFNYINPFYVLNSEADKNIYKCIYNNNGIVSTSEPTGQLLTPFITADGYIWQYMGSVNPSDAINFLTSDYIPTGLKLFDDSSAQWNIQNNAKSGAISTVNVINGGGNYQAIPTLLIEPTQGETITTPMTATVSLNGGIIDKITVNDYGEGYIKAPTIKIIPDGGDVANIHNPTITITETGGIIDGVIISNAGHYFDNIINVTINTVGGSGATLTPILDNDNILTGFTVVNGGTGYVTGEDVTLDDGTTNSHDYKIDIQMQPKNGHGYSIIEELGAKYLIINSRFDNDEGGYIPTNINYRKIMLVVDPLISGTLDYATAPKYKGLDNPDYGVTSSEDIKANSGSILYLEYSTPIDRNPNQIEDIKLILKF